MIKSDRYGNYQERKAWRREQYNKKIGKKLLICTACSGSGYYDNTGSPKCGFCEGAGRIREE